MLNGVDTDPYDPCVCEDVDGDGVNCDDCSVTCGPPDPANDGPDNDGDGICDDTDPDDDNDTVPDVDDTDPFDPFICQDTETTGRAGDGCDDCQVTGGPPDIYNDGPDADGDSWCDPSDNCPDDANLDQSDIDGDGVGDVCDNCVETPNGPDAGTCILTPPPGLTADQIAGTPCVNNGECTSICSLNQEDSDGDDTGDACDPCPGDPGKEIPGDGVGQAPGICGCGVEDVGDDDNDGVLNCVDQCPGVDDAIFAPECVGQIPTVSEWGLVILALLLLIGAKIHFARKPVVS